MGLPAAFSNVINPAGMAAVTAAVATLGETAVAGFGAATRAQSLAIVPYLVLSAGIGPVVGQNWGADRARRAVALAFGFCIAYGVALAVLLALLAGPIAGVIALIAGRATGLIAADLPLVPGPAAPSVGRFRAGGVRDSCSPGQGRAVRTR